MKQKVAICVGVVAVLLGGWIYYDTREIPCFHDNVVKCAEMRVRLAKWFMEMRLR